MWCFCGLGRKEKKNVEAMPATGEKKVDKPSGMPGPQPNPRRGQQSSSSEVDLSVPRREKQGKQPADMPNMPIIPPNPRRREQQSSSSETKRIRSLKHELDQIVIEAKANPKPSPRRQQTSSEDTKRIKEMKQDVKQWSQEVKEIKSSSEAKQMLQDMERMNDRVEQMTLEAKRMRESVALKPAKNPEPVMQPKELTPPKPALHLKPAMCPEPATPLKELTPLEPVVHQKPAIRPQPTKTARRQFPPMWTQPGDLPSKKKVQFAPDPIEEEILAKQRRAAQLRAAYGLARQVAKPAPVTRRAYLSSSEAFLYS